MDWGFNPSLKNKHGTKTPENHYFNPGFKQSGIQYLMCLFFLQKQDRFWKNKIVTPEDYTWYCLNHEIFFCNASFHKHIFRDNQLCLNFVAKECFLFYFSIKLQNYCKITNIWWVLGNIRFYLKKSVWQVIRNRRAHKETFPTGSL